MIGSNMHRMLEVIPTLIDKDESQTRIEIDEKLISAGWLIQDKNKLNLFESLDKVVREMDLDTGPIDYILIIQGKDCAGIEAKCEGTNLGRSIEAGGLTVFICDRQIKEQPLETLGNKEEFLGKQLDRSVIAPNQISTKPPTFKDSIFADFVSGRSVEGLAKALTFAECDDYATHIIDFV